jgi:hypothetical protein
MSVSLIPLSTISTFFLLALDAVQHIVVDVAKVGPLDEVDDIVIANNIAINASGGMAPNYGFVWSWQDQSGRHLYRQKISVSLFQRNLS